MNSPQDAKGRVREAGDVSESGQVVTISVGRVGSQNLDPRTTLRCTFAPSRPRPNVVFLYAPISVGLIVSPSSSRRVEIGLSELGDNNRGSRCLEC